MPQREENKLAKIKWKIQRLISFGVAWRDEAQESRRAFFWRQQHQHWLHIEPGPFISVSTGRKDDIGTKIDCLPEDFCLLLNFLRQSNISITRIAHIAEQQVAMTNIWNENVSESNVDYLFLSLSLHIWNIFAIFDTLSTTDDEIRNID